MPTIMQTATQILQSQFQIIKINFISCAPPVEVLLKNYMFSKQSCIAIHMREKVCCVGRTSHHVEIVWFGNKLSSRAILWDYICVRSNGAETECLVVMAKRFKSICNLTYNFELVPFMLRRRVCVIGAFKAHTQIISVGCSYMRRNEPHSSEEYEYKYSWNCRATMCVMFTQCNRANPTTWEQASVMEKRFILRWNGKRCMHCGSRSISSLCVCVCVIVLCLVSCPDSEFWREWISKKQRHIWSSNMIFHATDIMNVVQSIRQSSIANG